MADARGPISATAARALARTLRREVSGEVRFDAGSRALYATDASNYRQVPIGVVLPRSIDDVVATVACCRHYDAPILSRGGGTSLAGQCCNTAVVIDFSKYLNRVLQIDRDNRRARVQPGCVLDDLRNSAEHFRLTFGPDPATHAHNTLGGMIGNNSCGVHSVTAGRTADNVTALEVLTYDGTRLRVGATDDAARRAVRARGGRPAEIYAGLEGLRDRYAKEIRGGFPAIPRRVSGYDLDQLLPENGFHVARALVGSEGTCVVVLEAELRLVPSPPARAMAVIGFDDVYCAADHVPDVLQAKPIGLEGMDDLLIDNLRKKRMLLRDLPLLPEGGGWLLAEFGADTDDDAQAQAKALMRRFEGRSGVRGTRLLFDASERERLWKVRESGLGATALVPGQRDTWPGWEDSAVPREQLGAYLRELRALLDRYGYYGAFYGHFGDGCLHTRITFDLDTPQGQAKWRSFLDEAVQTVVRYGGSLSGEHGDGQARGELLDKMYGEKLVNGFREFKRLWDPQNRMNPGKVVDAFPVRANLRLPTPVRHEALPVVTHFAYPDDHRDFRRAALRCVGVGKCRDKGGQVMCPSYMATGEEMHSTRGRARLLFEMLHEGPLEDGWRSDAVHEALDLCLACKGCKSDCPVNVDMATYKAEFNSHYYKGRLRPRVAYALGWIYWWSRAAAAMPGFVNGLLGTPGVAPVVKWVSGIAPARALPAFAPRTFRRTFRPVAPRAAGKGPVMLWPDTFNNHFEPHTLNAAAMALSDAGYEVRIPPKSLCCGRPLYAWGWIEHARKQLRDTLDALAPSIAAGVPLVGLEPACVATFRDELVNLFPDDPRARALSGNAYLLDDFLRQADYRPPPMEHDALVHVHCHHHAIFGHDAEAELLRKMGLNFRVLDSGCCGMAGSFGFEREHYDVAMRAGERVLLPAVRDADRRTLIVSDGYSCREQIAQATGRRALHLSEVLRRAIEERARSERGERRPRRRAYERAHEHVE